MARGDRCKNETSTCLPILVRQNFSTFVTKQGQEDRFPCDRFHSIFHFRPPLHPPQCSWSSPESSLSSIPFGSLMPRLVMQTWQISNLISVPAMPTSQ